MCGIVGALDLTGRREFATDRLRAMSAALVHRGPDDDHVHVEPGLSLAARRLSIVDLSGGRQPLSNEAGDVWVAFNGELFEYPELSRELTARGHRLATHCDTELWVHMYEDVGVEVFRRMRGQFAVSLWEQRTRTLLLGRDRVGICPLFYAERDGWLLWASEIKALLASGLVAAEPDAKGIDYFFNFFSMPPARTCFAGVKAIPPGNYLQVRDGHLALHQYWDLDFPDANVDLRVERPAELAEQLDHLLRQAIRRRLRGDVPVVSYLSGGIDSTMVLRLSSQERGEPLPSFTVGLERAGPDERSQASESARLIGSRLTTVAMNKADITAAYPEFIRAAEAPVLDTACACLMRLAATVHDQGYKVALTGEGADEALAGYIWFKSQKLRAWFVDHISVNIAIFLRQRLLAAVGGGTDHQPAIFALCGTRPAQQDISEVLAQSRDTLYGRDMWDRLQGHSAYDELAGVNPRIAKWHPLNQSLYTGYKVMLAGLLLQAKGDRVAMHSSIETRYPFLDEDVIEFCAGIDPRYKLNGFTEKWLLRQVARKVLPSQMANRRKTMFMAKMSATFLGPERPRWVDQLLSPESLRAAGYFDPAGVGRAREILKRRNLNIPRRMTFDAALTGVIATQLWHHIYCGGGLAEV